MGWCRLLMLLLACAGWPAGAADPLRVAFGLNRPPFVFEQQGSWQGLELDVARTALSEAGYRIEDSHVPNRRLALALSDPHIAAAVGVQPHSGNDYCYSRESVSEYVDVAIAKARKRLRLARIADLAAYTVVAWQGASQDLTSEFAALIGQRAKPGRYEEVGDQQLQNRLFWLDRYDLIIVDRSIFAWYRKQLAREMDTSEAVTVYPLFSGPMPYFAAFRDCNLRDRFDASLKRMKHDGRYQAILDRYLR